MIGIADPLHRDRTRGMPVWLGHATSGPMEHAERLIFRVGPAGCLHFASELSALRNGPPRSTVQDHPTFLVHAVIAERAEALLFVDLHRDEFGGRAHASAAAENRRFFT